MHAFPMPNILKQNTGRTLCFVIQPEFPLYLSENVDFNESLNSSTNLFNYVKYETEILMSFMFNGKMYWTMYTKIQVTKHQI